MRKRKAYLETQNTATRSSLKRRKANEQAILIYSLCYDYSSLGRVQAVAEVSHTVHLGYVGASIAADS